MPKTEVDMHIDAVLDLSQGMPDAEMENSDEIAKFFEDAALATELGRNGHQIVARLDEETSQFHTRADRILTRDRSTAPAENWDAPLLTDDAHRLEKRYVAGIHSGKKAHRIEKSMNGLWTLEFDQRGELIRGYADGDEAA